MRKWLKRAVLTLLALSLFLGSVLVLYVRSDSFGDTLQKRIVEEVERASGGKAELHGFKFTFPDLKVSVEDFTLHGKESASQPPLFHVKSVDVELRILSFFRQSVDLRSIRLVEPKIHITADEHGNTNLPEPKIRRLPKQDFIDTLLDLQAKQLEIVHGTLAINDRRVPLELKTSDLGVKLRYENAGPRFVGEVSAKDMDIATLGFQPFRIAMDAETVLERGKVRVIKAELRTAESKATVSGFVYDLVRPASDFGVSAEVSVRELSKIVRLPIGPVGQLSFAGKISLALDRQFRYDIQGMLKSRGLAFKQGRIEIRDAALEGGLRLNNESLEVSKTVVRALGGKFTGSVKVERYDAWVVDGAIEGFATNQVRLTEKPLPFAAIAAGSVHLEGRLRDQPSLDSARASITLSPSADGRPVQGAVNAVYQDDSIEFTNSYLSTPESEVVFHGTLDSRIHVGARTANLAADIQPFLEERLPVELRNGNISFDGYLSGSTLDPHIVGKVLASNVWVATTPNMGQLIERASADIELDRSRLRAKSATLDQGALHLTADGAIGLRDWRVEDASAIQATLDLRGARIERLLREAGQADIPITGAIHLSAKVRGAMNAVSGEAQLTADNVVAFDEPLERIKGAVQFTPSSIELTDGAAIAGKTQVPFSLRYARTSDWKNGSLRWRVRGTGVDLSSINNLRAKVPELDGSANVNFDGEARIVNAKFELRFLQGDLTLPALNYRNATIENLQLRAATKGQMLGVTGRGVYQGARLQLNGEWRLEGTSPGEGVVSIAGGSIESLIRVFSKTAPPMPFQSALEGQARFKVALLDIEKTFESDLVLTRVQLNPEPKQVLRAGAREQDLVVTNLQPVTLHLTADDAVIESAQFGATNTRLNVTGRAGFGGKAEWDLRLAGTVNMAALQMLHKDLLATGLARLDAAVRGSLDSPSLNGSLQLENASLYFGDLPTGIDNVNGTVLFDRNRATVQALAGESGGGRFTLSGFVGFGGSALIYRLQAAASGVRVRYPEGASTTVNANLSLTGSSEDSLLAGTLSIVRAGFNPRTDFASMLAEASRSNAPAAPAAASNEYLRGMQFDLKIESEPNLEFQTTLTRGLHTEVDLRLRGNLIRPSLIGNVSFSEGEIALFGNKYTLNRGDIRFFNPTRIEPTFDLDAETRARGITVNVSFSGTPSKINAAYRSDPPLQPSEIIALLAIGRDPNVNAGLATSQSNTQSTLQGVGSLVGEAVAQSLNGRLQKFFGVTRIKIDPQLTGVENIPQARLTLEQQVSKDITLTYITNLARTQEQIVRIQWDISRQWSAIAVREENGLFGVDIQFRKRFK